MATYPSITLARSTRFKPRMGVDWETAVDGTFRGVSLHSVESYDITIDHLYMSNADATTLETFWSSNKYITWDIVWRGVTYNCYFTKKPFIWNVEGDLWSANVTAIGKQSGGG